MNLKAKTTFFALACALMGSSLSAAPASTYEKNSNATETSEQSSTQSKNVASSSNANSNKNASSSAISDNKSATRSAAKQIASQVTSSTQASGQTASTQNTPSMNSNRKTSSYQKTRPAGSQVANRRLGTAKIAQEDEEEDCEEMLSKTEGWDELSEEEQDAAIAACEEEDDEEEMRGVSSSAKLKQQLSRLNRSSPLSYSHLKSLRSMFSNRTIPANTTVAQALQMLE